MGLACLGYWPALRWLQPIGISTAHRSRKSETHHKLADCSTSHQVNPLQYAF